MSGPRITEYKIVENETLRLDKSAAFSKTTIIYASGATEPQIEIDDFITCRLDKDGEMMIEDVDIIGVATRHWGELYSHILKHSTGRFKIMALFEDGSIEIIIANNGKVDLYGADWWDVTGYMNHKLFISEA